MLKYTGRRLLQFVPVVLAASALCWALVWALPGDPFVGRCGPSACPAQYVEMMTEKYGLDQPLVVQYGTFLRNVLSGDLGETFTGQPILDMVARAVPATAKLAAISMLVTIVLAGVVGIYSGLRPNGRFDVTALVVSMIFYSMPAFVLAFLAQYLLGIRWHLIAPTASPDAPISELLLPAVVLSVAMLATVMRVLRTSVAEGLSADYLRTARSKGLSEFRVVGLHLMRNAAVPAITLLGLEFAGLLGGTVIIEGIFNIGGIGGLIYNAIQDREQLTVATVVTLVIIFYLVINLLVDLVNAVIDPRGRLE